MSAPNRSEAQSKSKGKGKKNPRLDGKRSEKESLANLQDAVDNFVSF